jgi:adenylylsulfate kinase-like enzyme
MITWITGNSGAGKTWLARQLQRPGVVWLDGDDVRGIWPQLGFSREDRWENNLRTARLAKLLESQGYDVVVSTICPYRDLRVEIGRLTRCKFIYVTGGEPASDEYPYEQALST